ncbi:MAG: hypothetical protein CVV21_00175 [Candidatus Goldiibacteriota bacterium HGW-Goldbacteria-1]|jgi:hypothetical protein|nr:MAG: hypothetical protein CVV21_00175 [Candidatus Goldiibacteriota bacterium HGW-Goldbacteria-1]
MNKTKKNEKEKKASKVEKVLAYDMKLMQKVAAMLEAGNIEEFIDIKSRPLKLIFLNFVIGLSRGVGFLLGATVVGAIILAIMKGVFVKLGGMPWFGTQIADILVYIKSITEQAQ